MKRVLILSQILCFGLIGILAMSMVGGDGSPTAANESGTQRQLQARCAALEEEVARLNEANRELARQLEDLDFDTFTLGAAIDDVQSMALQNSLSLRATGSTAGRGDDPGATMAQDRVVPPPPAALRASDELAYPGADTELLPVDPTLDLAVRTVLASIEEERRVSREERREEREQERFLRMAERFELTSGQLRVVQDSHLKRRDAMREIRDRSRTGAIPREYAREQYRAANELYRAELGSVLTEEQFKGVYRWLNPRQDRQRVGNDQGGGSGQQNKKQSGRQGGERSR
jgi:type IV secretory pathway VirB10-like protein